MMTANTSSAVMQQRTEPHDSLDDFPTPPWATRALCEHLLGRGVDLIGAVCREPAANRGHMVNPLLEYFADVDASDIHDYGAGYPVRDYIFGPPPPMVSWTITNPPFRLAEQFIERKQHDYPKLYTYAESAYWSPQLRELQDWIKSLTQETA
jgi:hypothetical protein